MLRPLLEQAADPVHQLGAGHTPIFSKLNSLQTATNGPSTSSKNTQNINEPVPSTAIIYKPSVGYFLIVMNFKSDFFKRKNK